MITLSIPKTYSVHGFSRFLPPFAFIVGIVVIAILALVLYPVSRMLIRTFYADGVFQFAAFREVMESPWFYGMLYSTGVTVLISGTLALLFAAFFAWLNERTDASFGLAGSLIPLVPLLVPNVAIAIGWTFLLSERVGFLTTLLDNSLGLWFSWARGLRIYSWGGLIAVYTMFLMPYAYVIISAAFKNLDPSLEEASRVNGGSLRRTAARISLPLVLPALLGAGLLMVMEGLSLYSAPVIIAPTAGIDILSVRMVRMLTVNYPPNVSGALVLASTLLGIILVFWYIYRHVLTNMNFAKISGRAGSHNIVALGIFRWPARGLIILYMLSASVLPLSALILVSLQPFWSGTNVFSNLTLHHYRELFWGVGSGARALQNSLMIGAVGATTGMLLAALLALFVKSTPSGYGQFADSVSKLPAAFPHILIAVGFLLAFGGPPFYLGGTVLILILAYLVIYLPQASIAASVAASQVGRDVEEAANVCGAGGARTFFRITLPLMAPGLIAGWGLLFVHMVGELTAASILASARSPVVGFVILEIFESGSYGLLAALATIVSLISAAVIAGVTYLMLLRR